MLKTLVGAMVSGLVIVAVPIGVVLEMNSKVEVVRFKALEAGEAVDIVAAAERHGWSSGRHEYYPTVDVPLSRLGDWPVFERVKPVLERIYGVTPVIRDLFVVKYHSTGQAGLEPHRDESHLSFAVALSKGDRGTHFPDFNHTIGPVEPGDAWAHPSRLLHQGLDHLGAEPRYLLVGFTVIPDDPPWYNLWGAAARRLTEVDPNSAHILTAPNTVSQLPYLRERFSAIAALFVDDFHRNFSDQAAALLLPLLMFFLLLLLAPNLSRPPQQGGRRQQPTRRQPSVAADARGGDNKKDR